MALRSISLLLIAAAMPSAAKAQAFGRFGYAASLSIPGFAIDREGFVNLHPAADRIRFGKPSQNWKPFATSSAEQTIGLDEAVGNPSKIRASLCAPGFSLYFSKGIAFRLTSTAAPYLTWQEGSASSGVPTPGVRWLVLSFRDAQPPLVLGFPDGPASLQVTGQPGAWVVQSPPEFRGWVRVGLPIGLQPDPANSAASLGRLAKAAAAEEAVWTNQAPAVKSLSLDSDEDSVTATWTFDRPGAIVPRAATLAPLGGYPLKVLSATRRMPFTLDKGPLEACTGSELTVRFPVRRVPTGRGLAVGAELGEPIGTVSPLDLQSVVELALETLTSTRDVQTRKTAEQTLSEYLSQATYAKEPWSDQLLPYDAAGSGIDLASAHALLMQSISSTTQASSEANSLLTSVVWRRDWVSWLPWVEDATRRRRSAALAALAGAICPEPERRLAAGMFQAGLSAERGLEIWQRRKGAIPRETPLLEPMPGLRQGLFRLSGPADPEAAFAETLVSPIRIYGDVPVRLFEKEKALTLEWPALEPKPSVLSLTSAYEIRLDPVANLPRFRADQTIGATEVLYTPEIAGACNVRLTLPAWAKPLPAATPVPRYSELQR